MKRPLVVILLIAFTFSNGCFSNIEALTSSDDASSTAETQVADAGTSSTDQTYTYAQAMPDDTASTSEPVSSQEVEDTDYWSGDEW